MDFFRKLFKRSVVEEGGGAEEAVIYYRRALKIAKYTGVLPYDWNGETQEVEFCKNRLRYVIYVSQYFMYLIYYGFLIYRWIHAAYFDSSATIGEKDGMQYVCISYGIVAMFHSCYFYNRHHFHNFINRLLQYVQNDFHRLPDDGSKVRKFGKFMRNYAYVAVLVVCLNVSTVFRRPGLRHLLTSLIPGVTERKKWELIPFALIHGYIWCNQWAILYFCGALYMSHIRVMGNALERTKPSRRMTPERFLRATRKLEILQGNFNALMRWVIWISLVFVVSISVLGICGTIWNEGTQALRLFIISVFMLGIIFTVFVGLGEVYGTSSQVLAEAAKTYEPRLIRMQMKAMRPIRVQAGGYFFVDAGLTLTLLHIISENTFNLLVAA